MKTVSVFVLCWMPFSTCNLLKASGNSCGGKDVERTLFTLAFFNSVVNPFIYFDHIKKEIKRLFGRYSHGHFSRNSVTRTTQVFKSNASKRGKQPECGDENVEEAKETRLTNFVYITYIIPFIT